MKARLALVAVWFLTSLFAYIGSAVPASAAGGIDYELCNSGNSESSLRAQNFFDGQIRIVIPGSAYCKVVSDYAFGSRIDPDYEAINPYDVYRWRVRADNDPTYGYWHYNEEIFDPPSAWSPYGVWMQTDVA